MGLKLGLLIIISGFYKGKGFLLIFFPGLTWFDGRYIMAKIEIQSFFYDLLHCKNKILAAFDKWDEKYDDDERGALVAGMRECEDTELINMLMNIQKLAAGYEQIKELMDKAEQDEVDAAMEEDDPEDEEF